VFNEYPREMFITHISSPTVKPTHAFVCTPFCDLFTVSSTEGDYDIDNLHNYSALVRGKNDAANVIITITTRCGIPVIVALANLSFEYMNTNGVVWIESAWFMEPDRFFLLRDVQQFGSVVKEPWAPDHVYEGVILGKLYEYIAHALSHTDKKRITLACNGRDNSAMEKYGYVIDADMGAYVLRLDL